MKLRCLYTSPNYYAVHERASGEGLALEVVCGGIAMYSVFIALSADEEAQFASEGHLDTLARRVAERESDFGDRKLLPRVPDECIERVDEPRGDAD